MRLTQRPKKYQTLSMMASVRILSKKNTDSWVLEAERTLREFNIPFEHEHAKISALEIGRGAAKLRVSVPQDKAELLKWGKAHGGDVFVAIGNGTNAALLLCAMLKPKELKSYRARQTKAVFRSRKIT